MMSILGTLFIGLIAGLVARMLKPGNDSMGWIMTALLGVAGSFLASYAGAALGLYAPGQAAGFIASVVGAIVLLVVYGLLKKNA
ncbi:GlsB/YeaQ/YmgE family stress response membrane protein [Hydrogenophaga flava]|uniref:GlsB/YeaQ/YmgE family stress response membrane protein n=1 Tax=Hydrogenophaga flava TaxID=65657 RepID=UPI000A9674F3|nr:GlsB/YeaQ/YmgE family stress response membrane protein [Hydrogenophaga flava]